MGSSRDGDSIRKYILAYDTDLKDLYSTGIPMDTIAELFRRYKAERVVFISDFCYSGCNWRYPAPDEKGRS